MFSREELFLDWSCWMCVLHVQAVISCSQGEVEFVIPLRTKLQQPSLFLLLLAHLYLE